VDGVVGVGRALYQAVIDADLGLADPYNPKLWHKVLNRDYSPRPRRAEWFRERRGRLEQAP